MLELQDVVVDYLGSNGRVRAVDHVSFSVDEGESFGLIGESGCGKSTLARAILRLLDARQVATSGHIYLDGLDILSANSNDLQSLRWKRISFISQNAMGSLDPVFKIEDQIKETLKKGQKNNENPDQVVRRLLTLVGLNPGVSKRYPHQLSGGQKQRVAIAMAVALDPKLVIADEATTALDVIAQDRVLDLIEQLKDSLGLSVVYISHDLGVIVERCNRIAVMYGGKIMEIGETESIVNEMYNPYTMGLKGSFLNIRKATKLVSIPGSPPNLINPPLGCRFSPRCPFVLPRCRTDEPLLEYVANEHLSACHRNSEAKSLRIKMADESVWTELPRNYS